MNKNLTKKRGFTLLELLIVIAVIAVLSVILVLVLNPAETLKKSRDSQRMSDLATIKTALGLYATSTSSPVMGETNTACKGTTASESAYASGDKIYYSYPSDTPGATISDTTFDGQTTNLTNKQVTNAALSATDGTGWLPVNLSVLSGGSPISNLPIDPINTIASVSSTTATDFVYRYVCSEKTLKYEIDARLESTAFTVDDNRMSKDGGNNANYYEVGTDLMLLGVGSDF